MFPLKIIIQILNFPLLTYYYNNRTSSKVSICQPEPADARLVSNERRKNVTGQLSFITDSASAGWLTRGQYERKTSRPKTRTPGGLSGARRPAPGESTSLVTPLRLRPVQTDRARKTLRPRISDQLRLIALKFTSESALKEREI